MSECCDACGMQLEEPIERKPLEGQPTQFKVVVVHRRAEREYTPSGRHFVFGRAKDADASIDDNALSRKQARLVFETDGVYVEDLNSACGTILDGKKVGRAKVGDGSKIYFGNTVVRVLRR